MLPTSPSADGAYSLPGSTPSIAQIASASAGETSSSTVPSSSPTVPSTIPVISDSASPIASTASANDSARTLGTEMSTERSSSMDSAVLALPEPMLASSRRASSCRSVYWILTGVLPQWG